FYSLILFFTVGRAPRSTLFPYTTLFRSDLNGFPLYTGSVGDGDFVYYYNKMDGSDDSVWMFQFYNGHWSGATIVDQLSEQTEYRSEEHTSELQSRENLVCRLLLEKKKKV